jgi:hypothetical protein
MMCRERQRAEPGRPGRNGRLIGSGSPTAGATLRTEWGAYTEPAAF